MKILIFGNPLVEKDNLPLKFLPQLEQQLPNLEFIHLDPTEELQNYGPNLTIIDTAENLAHTKLLTLSTPEDFNKLLNPKLYSMHDFDLGYNLKLLKKMGKIDRVRIICVPLENNKEIFEDVKRILKEIIN